jgi:long-chain acyl-CoA synthetase
MPDWFSDPDFKLPDLNHQSVANSPASDVSSAMYRDGRWPHFLIKSFRKDVLTLWDNFMNSVRNVPDSKFLATRKVSSKRNAEGVDVVSRGKYEWDTYQEIYNEVNDLAKGLALLGFKQGSGVGIFTRNRKEYVVTELASYALSGYNTAIYDTFGAESALFVINHSEILVLACSMETLPLVIDLANDMEKVKTIFCFDSISATTLSEWHSLPVSKRIQLLTYDDVIIRGKNNPVLENQRIPDAEDTACIMYTSGTTGLPKGVILTHGNFMASVCGMMARCALTGADRLISYLPLSHVLERSVMHAVIMIGGESGFFSGDIKMLVDDIQELKPTIVPGVPRVYEKIYASITAKIAAKSGLAQKLFNKAFFASAKAMRNGKKPPMVWEKLVFSKIKKNLGGRVRMLFSGGAPLNKRTQEYLSIVFACPLIQGYGLTETCGACCASYLEDNASGHNGPPTTSGEIKLVDVPEMNYFHVQTPPTGEICVRGPAVSKGYFKEPGLSADAIDKDGWFHTGDIGRLTPSGTFQIIDRKKNIFKLSQGLYIAAEALEGMYALSPFVNQVWIPGDSQRSFLVAVVVPAENYCRAWAEEFGMLDIPLSELCKTPELNEVILRDLQLIHKENGRPGFEQLWGVILEPEEWVPETGLTTPTLKLKRPALRSKYSFRLKALYDNLSEEAGDKKK